MLSPFQLPDELLISNLCIDFPCREPQIRSLVSLLSVRASGPFLDWNSFWLLVDGRQSLLFKCQYSHTQKHRKISSSMVLKPPARAPSRFRRSRAYARPTVIQTLSLMPPMRGKGAYTILLSRAQSVSQEGICSKQLLAP